jgi:hypothetical protein
MPYEKCMMVWYVYFSMIYFRVIKVAFCFDWSKQAGNYAAEKLDVNEAVMHAQLCYL